MIKLYYDLLSQPSRSLFIFLKHNKIPFEEVKIRLGKGEHRSEDFKKINPLSLVPVLEDNGFVVKEREKEVSDHWYPKDSRKQAKVDEYLEWQHLGTRYGCGMYFRMMWLQPLTTKKMPSKEVEKYHRQLMASACDAVEKIWIGDKKFICGDEISIADLLATTELEQPRVAGYDPRDGRPKLTEYMERVKECTNPSYDEAHVIINTIVDKYKGKVPSISE